MGRQIKPLPTRVGEGALKRCVKMWRDLFHGVLLAVGQRDGRFHRGLLEALKHDGLADDLGLKKELFDLNPPDEIIARVKQFYESPKIPNLKGKIRGRIDPCFVMAFYEMVDEAIEDLPRKGFGSPKELRYGLKSNIKEVRYWELERRLGALSFGLPPKGSLNKWCLFPNKEIARNVTADHFHLAPSSLKRIFAKARRNAGRLFIVKCLLRDRSSAS